MKNVILILIAALGSLSAQTIASGPKVWDLGNRSAQIYYTYTGGTITSSVLHYGTTCSYGSTSNFVVSTSLSAAWTTLLLNGKQLNPGTDYCYKIVINGSDALTGQHFVTLNETTVQNPIAPEPVTWFDVRNQEPSGTYNSDIVYDECSDWATFSDHADSLTGTNHQRYIFEGEWRTTGCGSQQYIAPARPSHTGKVMVYGVDKDTFAPFGTRVHAGYAGRMAKIWHNQEYAGGTGSSNYAVNDACLNLNIGGDDGIFGLSTAPSGTVPFIQCRADWPAHVGTINVVAQTCSVNANSDVNLTVSSGHGVTAGMLIALPENQCTSTSGALSNGDLRPYLVQSVTSTSIQFWALKRKSGFANITVPFGLTVKQYWRQPSEVGSEVSTGAGAPTGTCSENSGHHWYVEAGTNTAWWCVDTTGHELSSTTGRWRRFIPKSSGNFNEHGMLFVANNAKDYWFVGWEIIAPANPNPVPDGMFASHNNLYRTFSRVAMTGMGTGTQRIIFDRFWVHAENHATPPIRIRTGLNIGSCSDCGLLNSRMEDIVMWQPDANTYTQADGAVFVSMNGGGPSLFRNNYFSGVGTTAWYTDPAEKTPFVHDSTLERNTFASDFRFMNGHPLNDTWDGTIYEDIKSGTRNGPEIKKGQRLFWGRNKLLGYWSTQTKGGFFILQNTRDLVASWSAENITSISNGVVTMAAASSIGVNDGVVISGASNASYNGLHLVTAIGSCAVTTDFCTSITLDSGALGASTGGTMRMLYPGSRSPRDVDIRWNLMTDGPEVLTGVGPNADSSASSNQNGRFARIRISDNLCVNCNSATYSADLFGVSEAGVRIASLAFGFEHTKIDRNTFYNAGGTLPRIVTSEATPANWGLQMNDNLFHIGSAGAYTHLLDGNSTTKSAGLDYGWTNAPGGWTVGRNVVCCGVSEAIQTGHPAGMIWTAAAGDISFTRPSATYTGRLRDYRLKYDSPYKSGGASPSSTRQDLGVNLRQLSVHLGDVENVRLVTTSGTAGVLRYKAPDSAACHVETSTSATTWGTVAPVSDGGGSRIRNTAVTLDADETDYVRLMCETQSFECTENAGGHCALQP
jgi:hypothetical protein